jgi:predicted nuclease of predicted toxin-antitoxin system
VKILVDEMYPAAVAQALRSAAIDARTVGELRLAGASDPEVFGAAVAGGYAVLTENVGDFTRIAAEHSVAGHHHNGVIIALSSRFSRRPAGVRPLVAAVRAIADEQIEDRIVYLERTGPRDRGRP